jgi:hypothetical protein
MNHGEIPIVSLGRSTSAQGIHVQGIMGNEISDIHIESVSIPPDLKLNDVIKDNDKAIYIGL